MGRRFGGVGSRHDQGPAQPLAAGIARAAQGAVPGAVLAGTAVVGIVKFDGVGFVARPALSAPAVAGETAAALDGLDGHVCGIQSSRRVVETRAPVSS